MSFSFVAGVSPASNPDNANLIVNRQTPQEEFLFNMISIERQYYGGIKLRQDLGVNFFIETGALYTQRHYVYSMKYTIQREKGTYQELEETADQLIIPVSVGVRLKAFEVTSGLTAFTTLSTKSELNHINGFSDHTHPLQIGWHAGVGLNINKVLLGIEYQAALNRIGDGMQVHEQSLGLMHVPGQCVFSIQYRF
jgi:hypothetical protein